MTRVEQICAAVRRGDMETANALWTMYDDAGRDGEGGRSRIDEEPLTDAVSRLLGQLYTNKDLALWDGDPDTNALREAVELARRAYVRERNQRGELWAEFPVFQLQYEP